MEKSTYFLIIAGFLIALIPIVPKMVRLRIKMLRYFRWNRLAEWHTRHTKALVVVGRILMTAIALLLLIIALGWL